MPTKKLAKLRTGQVTEEEPSGTLSYMPVIDWLSKERYFLV